MTTPPPDPPEGPTGGDVPPPPPPPPGSDPYAQPPATPSTPASGGYGSGGYGQPAYGGAAYGQQPPGLGDALTYGWEKFKANVGAILTAVVVYIIGFAVVFAILYATLIAAASGGDAGIAGALFVAALMSIIVVLLSFLVQAGLVRGALAITRGEKPTTAHFFTTEHLGPIVVAALLVALATGIGTVLCYLPGIVVGYLSSFTLFFLIDKNLGAVDAIRASVQFTIKHPGTLIVYAIVAGLIVSVAALACLLPLLVAFPVVLLGQAYLYKRLQDEPVA